MLPNEPIDILAIASQRVFYFENLMRSAMAMNHSATSQEWSDRAWAGYCIAKDDMDAAQTLIRELAKSSDNK